MLQQWYASRLLKPVEGQDENRKKRTYVEVRDGDDD
jgi:hypothetical protein